MHQNFNIHYYSGVVKFQNNFFLFLHDFTYWNSIYICLYEHIYTHIHMYMYVYMCSYKHTYVHIYKKNMCVHGTGRYSIYIIYVIYI